MKQGFIKLHRSMLEWEWYDDPNTMRLFIHCLLRANHKDNNWRGILIKRGTFLTSLEKLSTEIKLSISQIRTAIKKLESTNEIASLSQARSRIITIVNYEEYQANDKVNDRIVTSSSQDSDKLIATNKNVKNVKNDKNDNNNQNFSNDYQERLSDQSITTGFLKPTPEQVDNYSLETGLKLDGFFDHYESIGWVVGRNPMKNWEASARLWHERGRKYIKNNQRPDFDDESTEWAEDLISGKTNFMGFES